MTASPFSRVVRLAQTPSTSTTLRESVASRPADWPHMSVLLADHQTAGHGRLGRDWHTPSGAALTASILVRPRVPTDRLSWLTLLAGLATVRALRSLDSTAAPRIGLKWPNDIVIDGAAEHVEGWGRHRKVAGILAEVVPTTAGATPPGGDLPGTARSGRPAVVLGFGINLRQAPADLPVPWATSLAVAQIPAPPAASPSSELLLDAVGHELGAIVTTWETAGGDADASGLRDAVRAVCVTLGRPVRVDQPDGTRLIGIAEDLATDGRLVVRDPTGERTTVASGDIGHVRR